ncbi:MAG: class I SAM-dependent methyltransferase [Paracoccaceae bacterium]
MAALRAITVADRLFSSYRRGTDFIRKFTFPGGMLPSPSVLRREATKAGMAVVGSPEFGDGCLRTLRPWRQRFNARRDEGRAMGFDERFQRIRELYLVSCASCFMAGTTDATQVMSAKNG